MLGKDKYANGQKVYEYDGATLTYYFKNGKVKAKGRFVDEEMEGQWLFYRETGELWQVGNFQGNEKHGLWKRFDRNGKAEYKKCSD